jgi:tetratricopeptide (TPR) repeat protein
MGTVWRAVHRRQGTPVAVKVMTAQTTREQKYMRAFRNEVRAVAGLEHPGIVQVFDYGDVTDEAASVSEGRLKPGYPFLAMELVDGGSLRSRVVEMTWPVQRAVLLALLDALGHAHARGVVHRDLKPENVLWGGGPWDVKLTDFGVAHALDSEELDHRARPEGSMMGTPSYMAPEQVEGRWRDHGPWTDLYALGCMAYEFCCGRPPFGRHGVKRLLEAHLREPPPPLEPRAPVPPGLEAWVHRLMAKDTAMRFERAADAAALLRDLPARVGVSSVPPSTLSPGPTPAPTETGHSITQSYDEGPRALGGAGTKTLAPEGVVAAPTPRPRPAALVLPAVAPPTTRAAVPVSWRSVQPAVPSVRLLDVGLGLYGLRAIPFVGRDDERETLWSTLRAVSEDNAAQAVVLRGGTGCGKTRLAEWLAVRAHEVGAATVLRAHHARDSGPTHGLGPMVARHLRALGLGRADALTRCERALHAVGVEDPDDAAGLVEILQPTSGENTDSTRRVRFRSPTEGYSLLARFVSRLATVRPVIIVLDDVQWGLASLGFALEVLRRREGLPVMLVLTVRDEALAERHGESEALRALDEKTGVATLEVGPLSAAHRPALMQALLGLDDELAARVDARTAGNPLFAVQLVGDWVQRGVLVPGPRGFTLRYGARAELPDSIHALWSTRIERLLEPQGENESLAVLAAGLLGAEVDTSEWRAVCERLGVTAKTTLVEDLLAHRLARCGVEGPEVRWAFQHGMLREALERRARELGFEIRIHVACAEMLAERVGAGVQERLGRHRLSAGERALAVAPLLEGARERIAFGEYGLAEGLLIERERAMSEVPVEEEDARWGEGWLTFARLARLRGRYDDAGRWARRATLGARWDTWAPIRAAAFLEMGRLDEHQGSLDSAWKWLQRAERIARSRDETSVLAQTRQTMGNILLARGARELAGKAYALARDDYERLADEEGMGACSVGLGRLAKQSGRLDIAVEHFRDARARLDAAGVRLAVAVCENELGELARLRGELEAAEAHCREALNRQLAIGAGGAAFPRVNLGLILTERGRIGEAREALEEALAAFAQQGRKGMVGAVHACLLPCCVAGADSAGFDHHLTEAMAHLAETGLSDVDIARSAQRAGEGLAAAGDQRRARDALTLARAQWSALNRLAEAEACTALIESSGSASPGVDADGPGAVP